MLRVFLLAVLGLVALALVARNLPDYPAPAATVAAADRPADASAPFARWAGAWEGEFVSRRPDGTVVETVKVRQRYTDLSPLEQQVEIIDQHSSGVTTVSNGTNRVVAGGLECRLTDDKGVTKLLQGRMEGGVIVWHRRDASTGAEESFREEILRLAGGDLYTIDGAGVYGGTVLLFTGRYRRADNPPR